MAAALVSAYLVFDVPLTMKPPAPPEVVAEVGPVAVERVGTCRPGEVLVAFTADVWAIRWMGRCWSRSGGWEMEPIPSERTEEWKADHRFTLADAAELLEVA